MISAVDTGRTMRRGLILFLTILPLFLPSCVPDPVVPIDARLLVADEGIVVLNEGIWRRNNAGLTLYSRAESSAHTDWYGAINGGNSIGDTGNEIVLHDNKLWVILSESSIVEVLSMPSGRSVGRLRLPEGSSPRSLAFVNDSIAWVTALDVDRIYRFDPRTLELGADLPVGPAPEGIAVAAGRLFVANSGLGALRRSEPGAGTITVLDAIDGSSVGSIDIGGNLDNLVLIPTTGLLYCTIKATLPDTTGGAIVSLDPVRMTVEERISLPGTWLATIDPLRRQAWAISHRGLFSIDLFSANITGPSQPILRRAATYSTLAEEVPHALAIDPLRGEILIGYARGYFQAPGRVDILTPDGAEIRTSFATGLNPVAILGY